MSIFYLSIMSNFLTHLYYVQKMSRTYQNYVTSKFFPSTSHIKIMFIRTKNKTKEKLGGRKHHIFIILN
jgi:hypothetical protein